MNLRHALLAIAAFTTLSSAFAADDAAATKPLRFYGAIWGDYQDLDWVPARNGVFEFGALRGSFTYDDSAWIGSGQIRHYRYSHRQTGSTDYGSITFIQHLWGGYCFADKSELTVGLLSHPFGLYPYSGNNIAESIAYAAGFEDTQSFGAKYARKEGALEMQLAFLPSDGGHGWANPASNNYPEKVSSRYSAHAVHGHTEKNTVIARAAYTLAHSTDKFSEFGVSVLGGQIDSTLNQAGRRQATALHYAGSFGNFALRLQTMRYDYRLNGSPNTITLGSFGYPYALATRGNIHIANLSYRFAGFGPISGITVYNDYSVLDKRIADFENSRQNVTGFFADVGQWRLIADFMRGKNSASMSPVGFNGLGSGAAANNTGKRININLGYYF